MPITSGTKLGLLEILSPLGAGGMGEVYRARDFQLAREVAIKVLPASFSRDSDRLRRFEREARAAAALNHPNILAVYQMGTYEGAPYLVSELLDGGTLREQLMHGPLPLRKAVDYGIQTGRGLAAAHEKGIVHRDLKPENLFVTKDGRIKILDFGLAKLTEVRARAAEAGASTVTSTEPGVVLGTVGYMSPEQVRGETVDHRTDLFALGLVLYEMLTGKRAFLKPTSAETMSAILNEDPPVVSQLVPAISPALQRVVQRCLEKNPGQRFQSASDLAFALEALSDSGSAPGPAVAPVKSREGWAWSARPGTSWRFYIAAISLSVVVAAALVWWLGSRFSTRPETMHVTVPVIAGSISGTFYSPVIVSPDSRWLVYLVEHDGHRHLYIRAFSDSTGHIMDGTDDVAAPFFSPDSKWIAFASNGTLNKLPVVGGGSPVSICTLPVGDDALGFIGGTWAADGRIIFVPGFNAGLWEVPAGGGTPKLVLATDASNRVAATHPQVLPNGKGVLFTSVPGTAGTEDDENISILEPKASKPRVLIQGGSNGLYLPTGHLVYGHAGKLFAIRFNLARLAVVGTAVPVVQAIQKAPPDALYSVSENGTLIFVPAMKVDNRRLFLVDRKGNRRPITDGSNLPEALSVSPDGKTVVARVIAANDDLWTFDINRGTASRLTFEPGDEIYPVWTPDGKRIAYGTRTGSIYWRPADGSGQREELSHGNFPRYPSSFSPDGKWLAIVENTPRGRDIWILPIGGLDRKPVAFATTEADEWAPKFSPNGRLIAYVSNESGTIEIYVKSFSGPGGRRRITSNGGQVPVWSRNGRELFFVRDGALMSVGMDANGAPSTAEHVVISADALADQLYSKASMYDVMPDGQHFVMSLVPTATLPPHYELVTNWFEEVKRLTAQ